MLKFRKVSSSEKKPLIMRGAGQALELIRSVKRELSSQLENSDLK
jgi:hypothetical protein